MKVLDTLRRMNERRLDSVTFNPSAINYKPAADNRSGLVEKVYLGGKLVGYVRQDAAGYYYEPIGKGARGLSMPSTRHVHRSLEN